MGLILGLFAHISLPLFGRFPPRFPPLVWQALGGGLASKEEEAPCMPRCKGSRGGAGATEAGHTSPAWLFVASLATWLFSIEMEKNISLMKIEGKIVLQLATKQKIGETTIGDLTKFGGFDARILFPAFPGISGTCF